MSAVIVHNSGSSICDVSRYRLLIYGALEKHLLIYIPIYMKNRYKFRTYRSFLRA